MEGKRQIIARTFGLEATRESNIAAYSAYADFIQHLHATYMALFDMEVYHKHVPPPPKKKDEIALAHDNFLLNEADRLQDPISKVLSPKYSAKISETSATERITQIIRGRPQSSRADHSP